MNILRAQFEDLPQILQLQYLAYQSEAKLCNNPNIPPLKQTLTEVEQEYEKGVFLKVVEVDGRIIGSVRAWTDGESVYVGKLMVHPDFQHRGIGTALLLAIEKEFTQTRFELFTSTQSMRNIALYQRQGYIIFQEKQVMENLRFVYLEKYLSSDVRHM